MEGDSPTPCLLTEQGKEALDRLSALAAARAGSSLSRLLNIPVEVLSSGIRSVRVSELPDLFGGPDLTAIGVLVPFQGDMDGDVLWLLPDGGVAGLEDVLKKFPGGGEDALRRSAYEEIGNVLTGSLLLVLSRLSEKVIVNLPPLFVRDMAGAILDTVLAETAAVTDEVTALTFTLSGPADAVLVKTVILPDLGGMELLMEAARRLGSDR